jgi:hypothetical protein
LQPTSSRLPQRLSRCDGIIKGLEILAHFEVFFDSPTVSIFGEDKRAISGWFDSLVPRFDSRDRISRNFR